MGLFTHKGRRAALEEAEDFDVVLVDEAHAARRQHPAGGTGEQPEFGRFYALLRDTVRAKARSLWLTTATPMQLHPVEACDLMALTQRVGAFRFDPTLTIQYYEILSRLVDKQSPSRYEWAFLRQSLRALPSQDPLSWQFLEESVIDGRIRDTVKQWLSAGRTPYPSDYGLISRVLFSAAPLSRVMLRHTRALLEVYRQKGQLKEQLARRNLLPLPEIAFTPRERQAYEALSLYCEGLRRQIQEHGDASAQAMVRFFRSFLRLRFASSPYAIRETLRRRRDKVEATLRHQLLEDEEGEEEVTATNFWTQLGEDEDDRLPVKLLLKNRTPADLEWEEEHLTAMLGMLGNLTERSSKMQVLLKTLDQRRDAATNRIRKTIVFTRFHDTLTDIVEQLRQVNSRMRMGTYSGRGGQYGDPESGRLLSMERDLVKERFMRGEIDVLVCTDAAAEGLNLQAADYLVNFDLGWNPMKLEQRIGRIDRIGQKHADVFVLNLCYLDSAEEIVYGRLLARLADANLIVGTQQFSLLPVEEDEFAALADGTLTLDKLDGLARQRIQEQRKRTATMEIPPEDLYEIYRRMSEREQPLVPVDLANLEELLRDSLYLRSLGCETLVTGGKLLLRLSGVPGVADGTLLSSSRALYEQGYERATGPLRFASYGEPAFEALLEHMGNFTLPPCVQRISVPVAGLPGVEMVGYAALTCEEESCIKVRLILSWRDLMGLRLVEDGQLHPEAVEPLRERLGQLARQEFQAAVRVPHIEAENQAAARAQRTLSALVISSLLQARGGWAKEPDPPFWPLLREVERLFEEREVISTIDLPRGVVQGIVDYLLFDCQVPVLGEHAHIQAPRILGLSAMDVARRTAHGMKMKKGDIRLRGVLSRLQDAAVEEERWL